MRHYEQKGEVGVHVVDSLEIDIKSARTPSDRSVKQKNYCSDAYRPLTPSWNKTTANKEVTAPYSHMCDVDLYLVPAMLQPNRPNSLS